MERATTRPSSSDNAIATVAILAITALFTAAQLLFPAVLGALRRDPAALAAGEWWRLFTPLLVHADGLPQIVTNLLGIALVGPPVERRYGHAGWLLLYFGAGLPTELIGYAWEPYGAGASIALCGLIGGLLVWLAEQAEGVPLWAPLFGLCLLAALAGAALASTIGSAAGAVLAGVAASALLRGSSPARGRYLAGAGILAALLLTALRNNHGPPVLIGAGIAALLLWRRAAAAKR